MSKIATTLEQLRDQGDTELREALTRTRDELFRLHLGQHTNQVTSTAQIQTKRRDIARMMTILNGRKHGLEAHAQGGTATETPTADTAAEAPAAKTKSKKAAASDDTATDEKPAKAPKAEKAKKAKS